MSTELVNRILKLNTPIVILPVNNNDLNNSDINNEILYEYDHKAPPTSMHEKYIILYKNEIDSDDKTNKLNNIPGFKSKHVFKNAFNGCAATMNKGLLAKLAEDDDILILEKDSIMNEQSYSKEEIEINKKEVVYWHQTMTNTAPVATDNFSNLHCYVLDTGIMPTHTEFSPGQVILDYNAISKNKQAEDNNGHGTGVASIIGGKTVGVANKTILHSIKVLNSTGSGYTSDIIAGLNWVIINKKTPCVINMSLGGSFSSTLSTAVQNCIKNGIQIVCASGNEGIDATTMTPAGTVGAITVSAYDSSKKRPSWSNYGSVVETFAPGVSLKAAWGDSTTSYFLVNGTSFSSPLVSGILIRYLKENPTATPSQILSYLSRANIANEIIDPGSTTTSNYRVVWNPTKIPQC